MKQVQKAKYVAAAFLFVFASTALSFVNVKFASALSVQWTGAGNGTSFSDTANWSSGVAPQSGDVLTFDVTSLTQQKALTNDITGLNLGGIIFTGTVNGNYVYRIQGNAITLSGNIQNTITGTNAAYAIPAVQTSLTLGADVEVSKVTIGVQGSTLDLQSHSLTLSGTTPCGYALYSDVSGTGGLNLTAVGINLRGTNTFSGPVNITGIAAGGIAAFGTSSAGTTLSGDGSLDVVHTDNQTLSEPFTLGGTGYFGSSQNYYGCSGISNAPVTLTLNGGVTLTSDFLYDGDNNLIVTEPFTQNGHAFTVAGGVAGSLTTPQGESSAPEEIIPLDGTSSTAVNVGTHQTAVLNGTRDQINVQAGGTLKGTGTVNAVYVDASGKIAPGNSPGTLTILNTFNLSGSYEAEVLNDTSYDKLAVGATYSGAGSAVTLSAGSTLNLVLYKGWSIKQGNAFTIIDNLSSTAVSGTFDGLAEGAQVSISGITFNISYVGGDGNDVVLTALNTGTDPSVPNTGVLQIARKNPLVVAGLGIVTAIVLVAIAQRRRQTK